MARGWRVLCAEQKRCTYCLMFGHRANNCPQRAKESK